MRITPRGFIRKIVPGHAGEDEEEVDVEEEEVYMVPLMMVYHLFRNKLPLIFIKLQLAYGKQLQ